MGNPRMLVVFTLVTLGVVGIVVVLATGEWWLLPLPLAAHLAATLIVLGVVGKALGQQDKPDPVTEAAQDEAQAGGSEGSQDEPKMAI